MLFENSENEKNLPNICNRMGTRINGTKFKLFTKMGHPTESLRMVSLPSYPVTRVSSPAQRTQTAERLYP